MGKRGPKKGHGGRPVQYPERMSTQKLPAGGNAEIMRRALAAGMSKSDWVRWRLLDGYQAPWPGE